MVVVVSFGQILPKTIIDYPLLKCLNIHPSLLPKYRGAAPLNWQIIRGETKTGITIMLMDEGMDSGDILLQKETELGSTETYGELHDRLAYMGATMLVKTIEQVLDGTIKRKPQDVSGVTFAPRLKKETGKITGIKCFRHHKSYKGIKSPTNRIYLSGRTISENFYSRGITRKN